MSVALTSKFSSAGKASRASLSLEQLRLMTALEPEDVVLGGGNAKLLEKLPPGCRAGDNANAFTGGFRLWENAPDERGIPNTITTRPTEHKYANG